MGGAEGEGDKLIFKDLKRRLGIGIEPKISLGSCFNSFELRGCGVNKSLCIEALAISCVRASCYKPQFNLEQAKKTKKQQGNGAAFLLTSN